MSFQFFIEYGWGAPPIKGQFEKFDGLKTPPDDEVENWQKDADAILRVSMRSLLPPNQIEKARNKLARKIEKWLLDNDYIVHAEDKTDA